MNEGVEEIRMNVQNILNNQLKEISPSKEDLKKIKIVGKEFCSELEEGLKKHKIKADVFIGGSLAKNTLIKKKKYDIDVFVRFQNGYKDEEISRTLGKIVEKMGQGVKKVYGSRNYYQMIVEDVIVEVVPVLKISKPEQAVNVTDLSYFHVNYVLKKLRANSKLSDEIILAKSFAHAQNVYGAESYIHGFSGYALELLVIYYGSFLNFIKGFADADIGKRKKTTDNKKDKDGKSSELLSDEKSNNITNNKIIIDIEKFYKNKEDVLYDMNKSKIVGPVILIDPTFKSRNAASSLSYETFFKFQKHCKDFLKKPSSGFFEVRDIDKEMKKNKDVKIIEVKTNKQAGDIAGTKSKKFYDFFIRAVSKEFDVRKSEFDYNDEKNVARFYLVVGKKEAEVVRGPPVTSVHHLTGFKKAHPKAFIKKGFAYVKISHDLSFEEWFREFLRSERKVIKGMGVGRVEVV